MFLTRTSCCKITHANSYYGAWPGCAVSRTTIQQLKLKFSTLAPVLFKWNDLSICKEGVVYMLYSFNTQCDNLWDCFPKLPIQEVCLEGKNRINQQITMETVTDLIWGGGSKITADGDCSHEIKRRSLLRRKAITNLDSIFESRDVT